MALLLAMTNSRWTAPGAVVLHRRAVGTGVATRDVGVTRPFISGLLEGERALKPSQVAELAIAVGAPRTVVRHDPRVATGFVRDALRRGELLAFNRGRPAAQGGGSLTVNGTFSDLPDLRDPGRHPRGWDAETGYRLDWNSGWTYHRHPGKIVVGMDVVATRLSLATTYFGDVTRSAPHARHGTVGAHEDLHKRAAQDWWTTERLRRIVADERIALTFVLPARATEQEVSARCQRQLDAIKVFVTALHQQHQETLLDEAVDARPSFRGECRR